MWFGLPVEQGHGDGFSSPFQTTEKRCQTVATKCKQSNRLRDTSNTRPKGLMTVKKRWSSKLEHMGRSATKEDPNNLNKRKSQPSRFGQVQEVNWRYGRPILESSPWSSMMLWCLSWPWSFDFAVGRCTFWMAFSSETRIARDSWSSKRKWHTTRGSRPKSDVLQVLKNTMPLGFSEYRMKYKSVARSVAHPELSQHHCMHEKVKTRFVQTAVFGFRYITGIHWTWWFSCCSQNTHIHTHI